MYFPGLLNSKQDIGGLGRPIYFRVFGLSAINSSFDYFSKIINPDIYPDINHVTNAHNTVNKSNLYALTPNIQYPVNGYPDIKISVLSLPNRNLFV